MPIWLIPLLLGAAGAGIGQAKTHHMKGTLEGGLLGGLGGLGLGSLLAPEAAAAGAAGAAGTGATSALGAGAVSDAALAASGSPLAGLGSALGTGMADAASSVPAQAAAALHPSLWANLGMAGLKGAAGTAGATAAGDLMTPKRSITTPEQMPFGQMPQYSGPQSMQLPSYMDQLRQLGFA